MLLECGSYAFGVQELCFWSAGAMLLTFFCIQNEAKTTPIYAPFAFLKVLKNKKTYIKQE
jgi:hypothetical protein